MIGIKEVAKIFGVSETTVRKWKEEGAPFIFFGKKWHTSYEDMWEWLKKKYAAENLSPQGKKAADEVKGSS